MSRLTSTLTILLTILTTVLGLPIVSLLTPRAGAPIASPLTNCTITNVYPSFPEWGLGYLPSPAFVNAALLYSYVLNEPYQLEPSEETLLTNCLETCHGYGDPGECQSVFLAYEFPDRGEGKELGTDMPETQQVGCLLFGEALTGCDLVKPVVNGTYTSARAENLAC
jgi:hypothetical protein